MNGGGLGLWSYAHQSCGNGVERRLGLSGEDVARFCQRWQIARLSLFGFVLRDDYRPDSDVDVLVSFLLGEQWSLLDLAEMEIELGDLIGRKVDLAVREDFRTARALVRRTEIERSAITVYEAL